MMNIDTSSVEWLFWLVLESWIAWALGSVYSLGFLLSDDVAHKGRRNIGGVVWR
jgi:hypothetical protein